MTLGVLTNLLGHLSLREALEYLRSIGVESLELGCGGYPGKAHCDPRVLLNDEKALEEFKATIEEFGMPFTAIPFTPTKSLQLLGEAISAMRCFWQKSLA